MGISTLPQSSAVNGQQQVIGRNDLRIFFYYFPEVLGIQTTSLNQQDEWWNWSWSPGWYLHRTHTHTSPGFFLLVWRWILEEIPLGFNCACFFSFFPLAWPYLTSLLSLSLFHLFFSFSKMGGLHRPFSSSLLISPAVLPDASGYWNVFDLTFEYIISASIGNDFGF